MSHEYTRFEEPFYKNYDLYEVEPKGLGPGAGFYQNMHKYKSISDFLKKKRKKKIKIRKAALIKLCKSSEDLNKVDFIYEPQLNSSPLYYSNTLPIIGTPSNSPLPQDLLEYIDEEDESEKEINDY